MGYTATPYGPYMECLGVRTRTDVGWGKWQPKNLGDLSLSRSEAYKNDPKNPWVASR